MHFDKEIPEDFASETETGIVLRGLKFGGVIVTISKIDDLLGTEICWKKTTGKAEWSATVAGEDCTLRMNNFPVEPLYTIGWRDQSLDVDDAPLAWKMPRTLAPRHPKP